MADLAAEISAKLGLSTVEFKAALADANASVKAFGEDGAHQAGAFTEAIHSTHKSMRLFHQFMVAGGIYEVLKGFFEMAIKSAEANTDATNENAEAVKRFADTIHSVHGGIGSMAMETVGFFNRIGESIGSNTRYAKEYWMAQITGNKDNLNAFQQAEEGDRRASEMEHAFAEEKKKDGAEFKRINDEIKRTEEEIEAVKDKGLPLQERVNELESAREYIVQKLAEGELSAMDRRKTTLELRKTEKALVEAQLELEKKQTSEHITANKLADETAMKGLTNLQKIATLTEELKVGEILINAQRNAGVDITILQAQQDERKVLLAKAQAEEEAKALQRKKDIAGSVKEELELLTLQHKVVLGIATGPEQRRLEIIQLQRKEREIELELHDIAERAITGKLLPADRDRLAVLEKQDAKLQDQIKSKQALIDAIPDQVKGEEAVTAELAKQAVIAAKAAAAKHAEISLGGADYTSMSSDMLAGIIAKQTDLLNTVTGVTSGGGGGTQIKNASITSDYGAWVTAQMAQQQIDGAKQELALRTAIQSAIAQFGQGAAVQQFGDNAVSRATAAQNTVQQNTLTAITSIGATLNKVFTKQATGIGGGA